MQKISRNTPTAQSFGPNSLENTRPPSDYKAAVIADYNGRYGSAFTIDPAKARLMKIRQDSFKPWLAHVTLGEDITDEHGVFVTTKQRTAIIERQEFNKGLITVTRAPGETPYATWKKVEAAAGLEAGELVAKLDLHAKEQTTIYQVSNESLNWYGEVRVKFNYGLAPTP